MAAAEYVRQTATLLGLNGIPQPGSITPSNPAGVPSGGTMLTAATTTVGGAGAANRYPWLFTNISTDNLTGDWDDDEAWFGEATFSVTEKLDVTVGARLSDKKGGRYHLRPTRRVPHAGSRRSSRRATCSPDAGHAVHRSRNSPSIDTYKFSAAYQFDPDVMVYLTYAEGFTEAGEPLVTIGANSVVPPGGTRVSATQARIPSAGRGDRQHRDRPALRLARRAGCGSTRRTSTRTGTACA